MSIVDDLEAAEDRIGMLQAAMRAIAGCDCGHAETAKAALELHGPYCRPSCEDHDHGDEADIDAYTCGCPAHPDPEEARP